MNAEHDATYSPGFLGERVKTFGVGAMVTNGDQTLTPPGLSAAGHQPHGYRLLAPSCRRSPT